MSWLIDVTWSIENVQSGSMDMAVLLEPFPEDVTARDRTGDSCVHVAAAAVDYELVKVWPSCSCVFLIV